MADESAVPVAVVTGGGSGIGRSCAQILSRRGCTVAVLDLNPEAAAATSESLAGPATSAEVDVASGPSIRAAIDSIARAYGRIDVLVTAAGHLDFSPLETMPEAQLNRMIDVHLKGTILTVQAVVPVMRGRQYGRIICISSVGARQGHANASHYTAAKAGIVGFVNSACIELGPVGVTVNCVLPGAVDTPMLAARDRTQPGPAQPVMIPVGGRAHPDDIGHVVAFLASPEARYVSGSAVIVAGGAYT
jgi:NAD(P)-dependent dehydrogenase (short-subunit alcohol dehydrogenase family)